MKKWIFGMAALAAAVCFGATTEDGVTKERRGALGPNDTVVTDVDATGIVAARTYTKDEVDRRIATNAPVRSVNGKSGAVTLGAGDVGALPNNRDGLKANANFRNAVWDVQIKGGGCDTNTVDALANSAVVTNALTVATTNRVALLESSKADKSALETHVANTDNPHAVTAKQVGAVPFVEDSEGNKTAVTIGSRVDIDYIGPNSLANGINLHAEGFCSHAEGTGAAAIGKYSHAEGGGSIANGYYSHAEGFFSQTRKGDHFAFAWNGDATISDRYNSHGEGTFNINPVGGLDGFYIGEQTIAEVINVATDGKLSKSDVVAPSADSRDGQAADAKVVRAELDSILNMASEAARDANTALYNIGETKAALDNIKITAEDALGATERLENNKADLSMISATNATFSNAVISVGLNIDTKSVAVLNEIAATFGDFPIEGTATTVGGLLAALAAAVAWLKKNKVQTLKLADNSVETSADGGVAKLDNFFTESNSLLTVTIDKRLPYPLNAVTDETGLLKDRAINTTSLASVTVPDNFTDLLVRASVASSLSVTMPEAIATKYGDTFPGEAGEYLITITKTGAAEAYVRTIKMEEVA